METSPVDEDSSSFLLPELPEVHGGISSGEKSKSPEDEDSSSFLLSESPVEYGGIRSSGEKHKSPLHLLKQKPSKKAKLVNHQTSKDTKEQCPFCKKKFRSVKSHQTRSKCQVTKVYITFSS